MFFCSHKRKAIRIIARSKYFDRKWYLWAYPDVKRAGFDAARHYFSYGWREGRNPSSKFNTNAYLDANPDVKSANVCPLYHWERHGRAEGRRLCPAAGSVVINKQKYYKDIDTSDITDVSFSIIMPTYNRACNICVAIDSVLAQSYQNFELIIVDDGSTDDTRSMLESKYESEIVSGKIKYIYQDNAGVCRARNTGLANAKNDWIAYLDSDNELFPQFLAVYAQKIVSTDYKIFYAQYVMQNNGDLQSGKFDWGRLLQGNYIDMGVLVHHRSVYEQFGGFDENMTRLVDWELILRYTMHHTPLYITEPVFLYNNLNDHVRITNSSNLERNFEYVTNKYQKWAKSHRVLVHLHLFYHDQLDYFLEKLRNITCQYDLFVTVASENKHTQKKLRAFNPDVKIIPVDNCGYDVWPFISVIKSIDLSAYDYVIKLHTKAFQMRPNMLGKRGFWWRDELVDVLLRDTQQFNKNLRQFTADSAIGMICSKLMLRYVGKTPGLQDCPEESTLFDAEFNRLGFTTTDRPFCAGTMFMSRAKIFEFLQTAHLTPDMFAAAQSTHGGGTLAHVYERMLGVATTEKGYTVFPQTSVHEREDEVIPVVFATDNAYMPYTIVAILSMLQNKKKTTKYDIVILHSTNIDRKYLRKLSRYAKKYDCLFHPINMKNHFADKTSQIAHISTVTYYRLLLPSLLKHYTRCIWLDGDTAICNDLSDMFHIEMGDNYIAGVLAPYVAKHPEYCQELDIADMNSYVNAGVLLWNLDAMRRDNLEPYLLELSKRDYKMMDQDILNKACFGRIALIPFKYNLMTKLEEDDAQQALWQRKLFNAVQLQDAQTHPVVIHYCGRIKPWTFQGGVLAHVWEKYAARSKLFRRNRMMRHVFSIVREPHKKTYRILGIRISKTDRYGILRERIAQLQQQCNNLQAQIGAIKTQNKKQ